MTDRSGSAHEDPRIAALERRLQRMPATAPPPMLRGRVLAAIDDVLAERRPAAHAAADSRVSGWAWAAAALVAVPLVTVVMTASWPLLHAEPITLAARLRAAGVADEQLLAAVVGPPDSHFRSIPNRREAAPAVRPPVRLRDLRRIPEELL